jgi:hypothetical protein
MRLNSFKIACRQIWRLISLQTNSIFYLFCLISMLLSNVIWNWQTGVKILMGTVGTGNRFYSDSIFLRILRSNVISLFYYEQFTFLWDISYNLRGTKDNRHDDKFRLIFVFRQRKITITSYLFLFPLSYSGKLRLLSHFNSVSPAQFLTVLGLLRNSCERIPEKDVMMIPLNHLNFPVDGRNI